MHIIEDEWRALRSITCNIWEMTLALNLRLGLSTTTGETPSPGLTWDIVKADDNGLSHITDDRGMKPFTSDPRCTWAASNENPGPGREGEP